MVWSIDMHHYSCEAAKIAPLVVHYLQGRCLDIGSGHGKVWPGCIGIDQQQEGGRPVTDICGSGTDLSLFADETMDGIFSSHFLEDIEPSKVPEVLAEWWSVLKVGGHLVLYLPDTNIYPHIGEPGCNPAHKWEPDRPSVVRLMRDVGSWTLVVDETRSDDDEYSFLQVYRKDGSPGFDKPERNAFDVWERNPGGKQRALVIRYGGIGDMIVAASILPGLKAQGYHITFNTKPNGKEVLEHDPHIDEWLIQANDFVPNEMLGPYWAALAKRYDRIINLSESVEGLLLPIPGRLNHAYPDAARRLICGSVNYLKHTHNIAAVPYDFSNARFHATRDERTSAWAIKGRMDGPVVVWCVNGSAPHKVYPWTQIVIRWLLERTPAHVMLYGDPGIGKQLAEAIIEVLKGEDVDIDRVHSVAGHWTVRQSLAFAQCADVVVGPETGPLNAVGMEPLAKVIYLSHSSPMNLTHYWKNTTVLMPEAGRAPCFPCHRLHHDWTHCHQDDKTGAALCASGIAPDVVFKAIAVSLGAKLEAA